MQLGDIKVIKAAGVVASKLMLKVLSFRQKVKLLPSVNRGAA
jgi:hypothetical protein